MSNYTISLYEIIQQIWVDGHEDEKYSVFTTMPSWDEALTNIDEKIEYARPKLFSFAYKCYGDEDDKKHLESHIIRKYLTREICCSSLVRWQLFLYTRMNDIMPKYIPMYNANLKLIENAINVLDPYHIEEEKKRKIKATTTETNKSTNESTSSSKDDTTSSSKQDGTYVDNSTAETTNKYSDTPQALMQTGKDYLTNMTVNDVTSGTNGENHNTGSNTVNNTSNGAASATSSIDSTGTTDKADDYIKTIKGNMSKYNQGELVKSYQDSIISIEELISDELKDLFYLMY